MLAIGQPVVDREALDVAVELDALVVGPVGAHFADDRKHQVLGGDARRQLPLQLDADALGHFQPRLAGEDQRGGLRAVDARGKHPQRPVHAGVRIAADDQRAGPGQALLDQHLVADARAHVVEMPDAVAADVLADGLVVFGVLFGRGRRDVIEHDDVEIRVGDAELLQVAGNLLDDRRRVVVREQMVRPHRDDLARPRFFCRPDFRARILSAKVMLTIVSR